jgi:hypothetical protein
VAVEIVVIGRLPLPASDDAPFELELRCPDGAAEVTERRSPEFRRWVLAAFPALSFEPASLVTIRRAWDNTFSAADALVQAIGGIVTDDATLKVHAEVESPIPVKTRSELASLLHEAFRSPGAYIARQIAAERERFANPDPKLAAENDWSDVSTPADRIVTCPNCATPNRIPGVLPSGKRPRCGACKSPLP